MGLWSNLKEGLRKTTSSFFGAVSEVFSGKIDEELLEELTDLLVAADVGVETAEFICKELKEAAKGKNVSSKEDFIILLSEVLAKIMEPETEFNLNGNPAVILVIGVNGVGKTTTIGKLASKYKNEGKKVIVAAADTFRAAAIEQLEVWCNRADVDIIKQQQGSDPAAVVFDAVNAAKARNADILIVDTAGRLHNKKNLMEELSKISKIVAKQAEGSSVETLLVLDGSTGQNGVSQAKLFSESSYITGIVLTKLDGTAKGGVCVAIKKELSIPVRFIGVGEGVEDLLTFDPAAYSKAVLGILED